MAYNPLHQHTIFSYLDGYCKIPDLVKKSKELGFSATTITDHNHLTGVPDFQKECIKQGIKSVLGAELYFTFNTSVLAAPIEERYKIAERDAILSGTWTEESIKELSKNDLKELRKKYAYDTKDYHIIVIAKDQEGWHNLVKLQSEASRLCTFNGRYHCDFKMLRKYHKGLIVTTACIGSFPSEMISLRKFFLADYYLNTMKDIFGNDFYLEIQPLNVKKQQVTNLYYQKWGQENNVKTVATNDSHWVNREDALEHDILLCIGIKKSFNDPARMHYEPVFWVRGEDEMVEAFEEQAGNMTEKISSFKDEEDYLSFCKQALANTQEVVDKVDKNIKIGSDKLLFPSVKIQGTPEEVLKEKAQKGLDAYLEKNPSCDPVEYKEQLERELTIICDKGFAPYFLTVEEMISWCDSNDIPTGPGRGSAAGSLTLLCLGVTKVIDPLKFSLMFSRFMTKDRTACPDVDCDVSYINRDKVISHLEDVYGKAKVSHIGLVSCLKVKSAIKDVARTLDLPFLEALAISKDIDALSEDPNLSFAVIDSWAEGSLDERAKYKKFKQLEDKYEEIFSYARKFEGIPRQAGVHASGILVMPQAVTDIFPVRYENGTAITLWTGTQVDEMKSVKLDILGLQTLDLLDKVVKFLNKNYTILDLYNRADINDPKLYQLLQTQATEAVFQLESNVMKNIISVIKPTTFNDVVAINALARPGPLSCKMHEDYAAVKDGTKNISYLIRGCEDILNVTYGTLVYQEQIMQISKRIAGFDDNQADSITRKIIGKKIAKLWPMLIRCHVYGKLNCEGPKGWEENDNLPWYDPKGKYGDEIEGAVRRGYSANEVIQFFHDIEKFSSYAFNKSHAASYSVLGLLSAWLKVYYPTQFWAAALTMADNEKKERYLSLLHRIGIEVTVPDINVSDEDFSVDGNVIKYGLLGIKGVGETAVSAIIAERQKGGPFTGVEDINNRMPKRLLRQNVFDYLIRAGCFTFEDDNRLRLLNKMLNLRNDKKTVRYQEDKWSPEVCSAMEQDTLNNKITYKDWWNLVPDKESFENLEVKISDVREHTDKNGKLMMFCTLTVEGSKVEALMFSSRYLASGVGVIVPTESIYLVTGKKDKDKFLISSVKRKPDPNQFKPLSKQF